jgi:hypothetical protein
LSTFVDGIDGKAVSRSRSSPQLGASQRSGSALTRAIDALRHVALRWTGHDREPAALPLVAATLSRSQLSTRAAECDATVRLLLKSCASTKIAVARAAVRAMRVLLGGALLDDVADDADDDDRSRRLVVPPRSLPLRALPGCAQRLEVTGLRYAIIIIVEIFIIVFNRQLREVFSDVVRRCRACSISSHRSHRSRSVWRHTTQRTPSTCSCHCFWPTRVANLVMRRYFHLLR